MENPCDECIVQVNCTQICFAKTNFKTLLKEGMKQFEGTTYAADPKLRRQYREYSKLLSETYSDIWKIKNRRTELENPSNLGADDHIKYPYYI